MNYTLTEGQQSALDAFVGFLANPDDSVFVLSGYSGTGKSTLIKTILDKLSTLMDTVKLLCPKLPHYEVALTATTNKAAENLQDITKRPVQTIHSFLGLRVQTDYEKGDSYLIPRNKDLIYQHIIFIDEASYVDSQLLNWIFKRTIHCKIVFMGDPAQLTPVKSSTTPVFDANFTGAKLEQVVRQAEGNPIIELSTKFRNTVNTGEFFSFTPDNNHIIYVDRDKFNQEIVKEFTRPDWKYSDSKVLAWTNKCVINYNQTISEHVKGTPHFEIGDYAVCNKFISINGKTIKTDQIVKITDLCDAVDAIVQGKQFVLDNSITAFMPNSMADKKATILKAKNSGNMGMAAAIENKWIDLRQAYACTINKAQGSTFDKVFIDLDDIRKCNSGNQIARMLYVAVSRAKHTVYLTGDLV